MTVQWSTNNLTSNEVDNAYMCVLQNSTYVRKTQPHNCSPHPYGSLVYFDPNTEVML